MNGAAATQAHNRRMNLDNFGDFEQLPYWAYHLIRAVEAYESDADDRWPRFHDGHKHSIFCFQEDLDRVSRRHLNYARAHADALPDDIEWGVLPNWLYDLLIRVDVFEMLCAGDRHALDSPCLRSALDPVPERELDASRVIGNYLRAQQAASF